MKRSRKVLGNLLELLLVLVSCLTPHCCSTLFLLGGNGRQFTPKGGGSWPASKSSECGLPVSETAVGTYLPTSSTCLWYTWSASIAGPCSDPQRALAYHVHFRTTVRVREVNEVFQRRILCPREGLKYSRDRTGDRAQVSDLCTGLPCSTSWLSHRGDTGHSGFCSGKDFSHILQVGSRVCW